MQKITKKAIKTKLKTVLDPELNISIVDLGLIYGIALNKNKVQVTMTLTTLGCPLYSIIEEDIKCKIAELDFKKNNINIKLVFDPPWDTNKMTKKGKKILGI